MSIWKDENMARPKKDSKPFSIRMETSTFERLSHFCEKVGQSKTLATERAIHMYCRAD